MSGSDIQSGSLQAPTPPFYTDPMKEHHSVRKGVGLFDLSACGRITVKGKDRVKFLQGLAMDSLFPFLSGASRVADDAAVSRVVRLSEYTWSGVLPSSA